MREFVEFLSEQSPYDQLHDEDLGLLARNVEVEFFPAQAVIVEADGPTLDHLFVVRTGSVEIVDRGRTIDILGPGDTFGHISVLSGLPPPLMVRAAEETLCYRLPDPRKLLSHPENLKFTHYGSLVSRQRLIDAGGPMTHLDKSLADVLRPIVWCDAAEAIHTVAQRITDSGESCALLEMGDQIGIVTDDDFRRHVATGKFSVDAPVAAIASAPIFSVSVDIPLSAAFLELIDHDVHHLVATDIAGRPIGIAKAIDMAADDVRHPLVVRSAITEARSLTDLASACALLQPTIVELWDAGVQAERLGALQATMIDSAFRKIVEMHSKEYPFTELECSWMMLGSVGRREPAPNSDVDSAVAWRQTDPTAPPITRDVVSTAAERLIGDLEVCGLRPCPKGLNASNPLFNRSIDGWCDAILQWRQDVTSIDRLLLASSVCDARAVSSPALARPVHRSLISGVGREAFTKSMVFFSLNDRPPSGFVREFVVEHFGEQKGHLNLKKAGLRPIASLARALSLITGDTSGSTTERLQRAHQCSLLSANDSETLQGAFALCYQLVVAAQVEAIKGGRETESTISVSSLDSLERRHLRDAFRLISQIQDRVGRMRNVW